MFPALGLPEHFFHINALEYYGDISFLKAGIRMSDAVTTVSPTYAREILTEEQGMGMAGVLQSRRSVLSGIVNGIDEDIWDPLTDPFLAGNYGLEDMEGKQANREAVERFFGLTPGDGAILSVISRLTWQKGIDLLAPVVPGIIDRGARLIVIGEGDPSIVYDLAEQARKHSGRVVVHLGFSEESAHLLHAGQRYRHSAIPLRTLRSDPALRPEIRRHSYRRPYRRAGGDGDRRERGRRRGRRGHRLPVQSGFRRGSLQRHRPGPDGL